MQQGVQTDQQYWELLANNVASVCTQPKAMTGHSNDTSYEQRVVCQLIILTWRRTLTQG